MNLPAFKARGLTPSQQHSLVALVGGAALQLNDHWPQVTALVGQHYAGLPIPSGVSLVLSLAAFAVTSLSRALNRGRSGTGTGIVGAAPDTAAEASQGGAVALPPMQTGDRALNALPDLLTTLLPRLSGPQTQAIIANVARMVAEAEAAAHDAH